MAGVLRVKNVEVGKHLETLRRSLGVNMSEDFWSVLNEFSRHPLFLTVTSLFFGNYIVQKAIQSSQKKDAIAAKKIAFLDETIVLFNHAANQLNRTLMSELPYEKTYHVEPISALFSHRFRILLYQNLFFKNNQMYEEFSSIAFALKAIAFKLDGVERGKRTDIAHWKTVLEDYWQIDSSSDMPLESTALDKSLGEYMSLSTVSFRACKNFIQKYSEFV